MSDTKIIKSQGGEVRGQKMLTAIDEKEYYAFKGIPYAQPPIGNLRFKVYFMIIVCVKNTKCIFT